MNITARLGNLWLEIRATRPVAVQTAYTPRLPDLDATDELADDEDDAPEWEAQSITGRSFIIIYNDSKGQGSERQVVCRRLEAKAGTLYLTALCLLRDRPRSFRADRIASMIDPATGAVHEPGIDFLRQFTPDSASDSRFHYGLSPQAYTDFNAALNVLAFIARCDGTWHPLEADAIEQFATSYWMRAEITAPLDIEEVVRHAARLAPDAESLWTSLMRCQASPILNTIIRRHIAAVIDADGAHHPHEIYWGQQVDEFMAMA